MTRRQHLTGAVMDIAQQNTFKEPMLRNWTFTWNNPTLPPEELLSLFYGVPNFRYLVFQKEVGENGTIHYQGYVEFKRGKRLQTMKRLINQAHWEPRYGTRDQARHYCMKPCDGCKCNHCKSCKPRVDGPWEQGDYVQTQGTRTDLGPAFMMAANGATNSDIFSEYPVTYGKYWKNISHIRSLSKPGIRKNLKVLIFYGKPGTGKTRYAYDKYPDLYAIPCGRSNNLWFDGYQGDKVVLLDDFSGQYALSQLLRLLDIYPIYVETKGGHVWFTPDTIIITTNEHPLDWYKYEDRQDSYEALVRRFGDVYWFNTNPDNTHSIMHATYKFFLTRMVFEEYFAIVDTDATQVESLSTDEEVDSFFENTSSSNSDDSLTTFVEKCEKRKRRLLNPTPEGTTTLKRRKTITRKGTHQPNGKKTTPIIIK